MVHNITVLFYFLTTADKSTVTIKIKKKLIRVFQSVLHSNVIPNLLKPYNR